MFLHGLRTFFLSLFLVIVISPGKTRWKSETTQRIMKQPLSQTPGEVFQKHKYFHEAVMHLVKILYSSTLLKLQTLSKL